MKLRQFEKTSGIKAAGFGNRVASGKGSAGNWLDQQACSTKQGHQTVEDNKGKDDCGKERPVDFFHGRIDLFSGYGLPTVR
jgi:hypothetical protein